MNRAEIGEKFKADILEAAHGGGLLEGGRVEVKPLAPATKLYKECAAVKHELAQMGIDIEYENRDGGYAILTRWGVPARPTVEPEVVPEEWTNIPPEDKRTVEDRFLEDDRLEDLT